MPQSRNVDVSPDGAVAWFDEVLGHARYGVCRGTGVLRANEGGWKVAQYNLTVPVPNELMGGVVQRIAAFADGAPSVATTVVLVRHAEKQGGRDPSLTDAGRNRAEMLTRILRRVPIAAVYTSEFRRTQETVAPLCRERELEPRVVAARDVDGLVARLRQHRGETVIVAGHSNTLPAIVKALGIDGPLPIADDDYDNLLILTVDPEESRLLRLTVPG